MTEVKQIYKCEICGNIVEVVHSGAGTLVCCGKPMVLKKENTTDGAKEKHVPIIEKIEGGVLVKVGEVEHPMIEEHYIEWIEVHTENKVYRKYLKPGEKPQAEFKLDEEVIAAREYCNLHGLWKK
ncbi:superoxide reductase [Clostridium tetanomorphum]|uniref:Desulfoferrodoxin n=1 Tax=Clostridium tetanomorphum TaxID=1553 RepID=A0A923J2T8_CLOTT|nr:desulfoferrodoxin [Clostridium tetanomorphum]KAJ51741.1 desulfoferrodoxin [Clostridium tetanomorphum DSM 665]MBC2399083.1 desulfoferrodoxin [Clostridium tetanomorphum]MBP1865893.1 superoxide reductase [Clostridium tetanomorphum]NRS86074.1 superoxide reductase [Clostridium tetanomorphum]NRZ95904.1 superoxide reductase [Clostridium tetanomorphum]